MEARFEPPRNANIVKAVVLMKKVVEEEGRHKYMIFAGRRIDFHPGDNPRKIIHNFLHPPLPVD